MGDPVSGPQATGHSGYAPTTKFLRPVAPAHDYTAPPGGGITVVHSIHRVGRVAVPSRSYERSRRAAPSAIAPIARTSI